MSVRVEIRRAKWKGGLLLLVLVRLVTDPHELRNKRNQPGTARWVNRNRPLEKVD